jgi:hypothetical protein
MGGRYGKYGEIKRFERLRKNRRDSACGQGRPRLSKDNTRRLRPLRKRFRQLGLRD